MKWLASIRVGGRCVSYCRYPTLIILLERQLLVKLAMGASHHAGRAGWRRTLPPCPSGLLAIRPLLRAEFDQGQASAPPVFDLDLFDHDKGRFEWLVEDVQQQLAGSFDQGSLLSGGDSPPVGCGALAGNLNRDHRHKNSPRWNGKDGRAALAKVSDPRSGRHRRAGSRPSRSRRTPGTARHR